MIYELIYLWSNMVVTLASGMFHSRGLHYLLTLPFSMHQVYVPSDSFNS